MTAAEAIAALGPIVGAGGIGGIVMAVLAYLREVRGGRTPPAVAPQTGAVMPGGTTILDTTAIGTLATGLQTLALSIAELAERLPSADERHVLREACEAVREMPDRLDRIALDLRRDWLSGRRD